MVADAARDAWVGVESAAIIASSPAAPLHDNVQFADAVADAAVTALANANEALGSAADARGVADQISEATDDNREPEIALMVDPPSWATNPTGLEAEISGDLAFDSADVGHDDLGGDTSAGLA